MPYAIQFKKDNHHTITEIRARFTCSWFSKMAIYEANNDYYMFVIAKISKLRTDAMFIEWRIKIKLMLNKNLS